jgi:stage V sporulation protein D (sporulation-specific penicillin-binding protein)
VLIFLFAAVLIGRLYFVQIVHGDAFSSDANRQYIKPAAYLYDRGTIFFEDKDGHPHDGATIKSGFTVVMNPSVIEDAEQAYEKLSPLFDIDKDMFFLRAGKKNDPYEEIDKKKDKNIAKQIEDLAITGIGVEKSQWRYYPGDSLGAQTLGFVGYSGDELAGRYGLERYYNDVLERNPEGHYVNFFADIFANVNSSFFDKSSESEGDIVTSIEPSVQLFLEDILDGLNKRWNSKLSAGVIINPKNGEIYALGVNPTFNLNSFQEEESSAIFSNPVVENVYEMGSIIKPLTMAAGLDSGAVTSATTYYDAGTIELDTEVISNFDKKGRGRVSMQEVLNQSLNTGAAHAVSLMGNDTFRKYMHAFGIGEETGIDLPNESAGLVENLESPRDIEYATASFGQGIAMTPIATVRALSTLANGGVLITPHVAKKIKYKTGLSKNISYADGKHVLKPESAEEITRMLVNVVDNALLDGAVKIPNYSIAAKTGTAQIAKVDGRGYYDDRFLHSFFGYFPAYDAKFLIFLYTVEPKEVRYASQTLTGSFMDTVKFLTNYYEIPPDR